MILDSFDNESVLSRCVKINIPPFKYISNKSMPFIDILLHVYITMS